MRCCYTSLQEVESSYKVRSICHMICCEIYLDKFLLDLLCCSLLDRYPLVFEIDSQKSGKTVSVVQVRGATSDLSFSLVFDIRVCVCLCVRKMQINYFQLNTTYTQCTRNKLWPSELLQFKFTQCFFHFCLYKPTLYFKDMPLLMSGSFIS